MRGTKNSFAVCIIASFLTLNTIAGSVPGKDKVYPTAEINFSTLRAIEVELTAARGSELNIENIQGKSGLYNLGLDLKNIADIQLLRAVPRLRGRLIEVYSYLQKSQMSRNLLRVKFIEPYNLGGVEHSDLVIEIGPDLSDAAQYKVMKQLDGDISYERIAMSVQAKTLEKLYEDSVINNTEITQYDLDLPLENKIAIVGNIFYELEDIRYYAYSRRYNSSASVLWGYIDQQNRKVRRSLYTRRKFHKSNHSKPSPTVYKNNPYLTAKNIKRRKLTKRLEEWRFLRLRDEMCVVKNLCSQYLENVDFARNLSELDSGFKDTLNKAKSNKLGYVHKNQSQALNNRIRQYLLHDNELLRSKITGKITQEEMISKRLSLWVSFVKNLSSIDNYDLVRFFEEGDFEKTYPNYFVFQILDAVSEYLYEVEERGLPQSRTMAFSRSQLENYGEQLTQSMTDDELSEFYDSYIDKPIEVFGADVLSRVVNFLGQVFKKRPGVPYIRLSTNFRKNHLTKYRERVLSDLFSGEGMKQGDIIVEKDMQANTDVLIPGYWIHAAVYIGSIKELKQLGVWDSENFKNIRTEMELYQTDKTRRKYLNEKWGNKDAFEDIPWFVESDRPGVSVHPFIKFLKTDGMAVLRPTSNWDADAKRDIMKRLNDRMHFQYDYVHNVRNKFSVSCSKIVLKAFDQITFPISKQLKFYSVSPDQIAQPVSLDPRKPNEGELKLIMFLDAKDKGRVKFRHDDEATFKNYRQYLKASGVL